ncbi:MAG: diguanylate cyclase, partial [Massilia sp.]
MNNEAETLTAGIAGTERTTSATILVVDDELVNRRLMQALLTPEGYLVEWAESGAEALRMVAQRPPDLILLDIMMPGMDGYQVAASLKSQQATSHIPIIMLTALADKQARLAGLAAGAEELLTKPIERTELWLRVRNLLRLKSLSDLLLGHSEILEQQVSARSGELQRFRSAMDATADAILLIDRASMLFIEVNATACAMLGYSRAALLRLGPAEVSVLPLAQLTSAYDALIADAARDALSEMEVRHSDGSVIPVDVQRKAHLFEGKWMIVVVLRDIRERKLAERRLHHMAHYDGLTGLPNRSLFYDTLSRTLSQAAENDWQVAVLLIDLDHFKDINDTMGHAVGDALLVEVSERLLGCVRARDTLGRLGGDEFAVILVTRQGRPRPDLVATKLLEALHAPVTVQQRTLRISASIGIAVQPTDATDADTLIRFADTAMQRAKHAGRNTFVYFTTQMNIDVQARLALERDLARALEQEEFVLHYQPKIELSTGRVAGVEALLRWNRPGHGMVPPNAFIPVLEETGLIGAVGLWVIRAACQQIKAWQRGSG